MATNPNSIDGKPQHIYGAGVSRFVAKLRAEPTANEDAPPVDCLTCYDSGRVIVTRDGYDYAEDCPCGLLERQRAAAPVVELSRYQRARERAGNRRQPHGGQ